VFPQFLTSVFYLVLLINLLYKILRAEISQSVQRLCYGLDERGSRVRFPAGAGALSLGVKRPRREAGHSPPSSTEVKE
jgi:hypothetical protein